VQRREVAAAVVVLNRQRKRRVNVARLRGVIGRAAAVLNARAGDVVVLLGRDLALRRLNRSYRGKDAATDVLAFEGGRGSGVLGDIVISIDAAERNAAGEGHSLVEELEVLVLHGWLHLLGYDHESDQGAMMRLERRLRRKVLTARSGAHA
jgi:probable rRNA maturation factor